MRRISICGGAALILVALAIPASTGADPRPTGTQYTVHDCGQHTAVETGKHGIRITHIEANGAAGKHGHSGCYRAKDHLLHEFIHNCLGGHSVAQICNIGVHDRFHYDLSCQVKHITGINWHACYNQSTGAKVNYTWHRPRH